MDELSHAPIEAHKSTDGGRTWELLGRVPPVPGATDSNCHEPHVVELPSGRLVAMVRIEDHGKDWLDPDADLVTFSMVQTASDDGGRSWSVPTPLGYHGSPPHLMRHSSGALVLSYVTDLKYSLKATDTEVNGSFSAEITDAETAARILDVLEGLQAIVELHPEGYPEVAALIKRVEFSVDGTTVRSSGSAGIEQLAEIAENLRQIRREILGL